MAVDPAFYAVWQAALTGTAPDPENDKNICGFWRIGAAKTKPDTPVAIWGDGTGQVAKVGRRTVFAENSTEWHDFIAWGWTKCTPVRKADYDAALASGFWPSDNKPSRKPDPLENGDGSNEAPVDETLADQIEALAEVLDEIPEPQNQKAADNLSEKLDRMRSLLKLAGAKRDEEVLPHKDAAKAVETKWSAVMEPGQTAGAKAEARRKEFLKKEDARLKAEAEAARQKKQAAIDAENERVRKVNAEIAAENKRLADAAEKAKAEAEAAGKPVPETVAFVPIEMERELAPAKAEDVRARAGGAFGRSTGLRKTPIGTVTSVIDLATHFVLTNDADFLEYLAKRAQAAARAKVTLPGVTVTEEMR